MGKIYKGSFVSFKQFKKRKAAETFQKTLKRKRIDSRLSKGGITSNTGYSIAWERKKKKR